VKNSAAPLVQCPDRKGLDAALAEFLYRLDGNIPNFEQHSAGQERFHHARVEWDLSGFKPDLDQFDAAFGPVAHRFGMNWSMALSNHRPPAATFVSRYDHCLVDLLYRQRGGELGCDFSLVISNHPDTKHHADFYGVPFSRENKAGALHADSVTRFRSAVSAAHH
jgi:formyltetrahydrofolate deformylase